MLKKIKIAIVLLTLAIALFRIIPLPFGNTSTSHFWHECDAPVVLTNITDPLLDNDPTKDEVLIVFESSVSKSKIKRLSSELGLSLAPTSHKRRIFKAAVPEGAVPRIHAHIHAHGYGKYIRHVEENVIFRHQGKTPNDPLYPFQWNLEQVNAQNAWSYATGKGVVVAVLDTGIMLEDFPELNLRQVKDLEGTSWVEGYDFVEDSIISIDLHGHGTHVAGTIAQTANNDYGVVGLAPQATLMSVRVLDEDGSGSSDQVADGIIFAARNGANIINMSLGSSHRSHIIEEAVNYAHKKGVTIVAAAGNSGRREPSYPASYAHVISVAATQYNKDTTFYSQFGPTVDIAAPGGNTRVDQNGDGRPDGILQETISSEDPSKHDFHLYMGTSMASPHVAAAAALIYQRGVTNPKRIEYFLKKGADTSPLRHEVDHIRFDEDDDGEKDGPPSYEEREFTERYGAGILQADRSVKLAILETGKWRFLITLCLSLLFLFIIREGNLLDAQAFPALLMIGTSLFVASGFFLLPFILPFMDYGSLSFFLLLLATPVPQWDWVLFNTTLTPFMASALIPAGLVFLLHGHPTLKYLASGISLGFAGFLFTEAVFHNTFLLWIPNIPLLHLTYYLLMGTTCVLIPFQSLRKGV
jgi:serine protease